MKNFVEDVAHQQPGPLLMRESDGLASYKIGQFSITIVLLL